MKVMVIIKATQASEAGEMPSQQLLTEMGNYNEALVKAGIMLAGEGLHPSSKGVRVGFSGQDRVVIDGPFAETKELIAGFWMWQVKSMEEAIEWLKRCPNPHDEPCEVEIRPVFSADDFGAEFTPELREQEANVRAQALGLGEVKFLELPALKIAGLTKRYDMQTRSQIGAHWDAFGPHLGRVPGQVGHIAYGVCYNASAQEFDYLSGVEVQGGHALPAEFTAVDVPARRYAVFTHRGPVATLPQTIDKVWREWSPDCGLKIAAAPCLERYTEEFNPSGGGMELWLPLEA